MTFFVALCLCGIAFWATEGFSPYRIAVPLLDQEEEPISFSFPTSYRYLGRGKQAFVFERGDWVIKFFNKNELVAPLFLSPKKKRKWEEKVRIFPESYPLAQKLFSEETGVVAVHLGINRFPLPTVELIDRLGRRFHVDLSITPFVIQKRGKKSFYRALADAAKNGTLESILRAYLSFHARRISLLIADGDRDIKRNYCWNGTSLQYIDPARFFFEPGLAEEKRRALEWWKCTHRLKKWIEKHAPEQLALFDRIALENMGGVCYCKENV